jgi:hypothetical protein
MSVITVTRQCARTNVVHRAHHKQDWEELMASYFHRSLEEEETLPVIPYNMTPCLTFQR